MKGFYKVLYKLLAKPLRLIFNIRVEGSENEPKADDGAFIVCSNHISAGDPIWLCISLRYHKPNFMAKAELFKIPLLNSLIRFFGAYPVERSGADVSAIRHTISMLKEGTWVGMFPQGTRCKGKNPIETKVRSGVGMIATRAKVGVLPIYIDTKNFQSSLFGRKHIIIGEPISAEKITDMCENGADYNEISNFIFSKICALGGIYNDEKTDE